MRCRPGRRECRQVTRPQPKPRFELEAVGSGIKMTLTHVGLRPGSPGAPGWAMAFDKLTTGLREAGSARRASGAHTESLFAGMAAPWPQCWLLLERATTPHRHMSRLIPVSAPLVLGPPVTIRSGGGD